MKKINNGTWACLIIFMSSTLFEMLDQRVFFTGIACLLLLILLVEEKDSLVKQILAYLRERLSDSDQANFVHSLTTDQGKKDQAPPAAE
ncbi:hypothetical protein JOD20_002439 [Herpetosiphon giganteus]|nr:hypothetical protein [Herpetosiphon giganteus]